MSAIGSNYAGPGRADILPHGKPRMPPLRAPKTKEIRAWIRPEIAASLDRDVVLHNQRRSDIVERALAIYYGHAPSEICIDCEARYDPTADHGISPRCRRCRDSRPSAAKRTKGASASG